MNIHRTNFELVDGKLLYCDHQHDGACDEHYQLLTAEQALELIEHMRKALAAVLYTQDDPKEICAHALGVSDLAPRTSTYKALAIAAEDRNRELSSRLTAALERMDRAREILTNGNPTTSNNWGMLDTGHVKGRPPKDGYKAVTWG